MNVMKQSLPQTNRIVDLDVIRGFALIGILLMNIDVFAGEAGVEVPSKDHVAVFVTGKFYAIFSLLFGAGAALFLMRVKDKGQSYSIYIRRMVVLGLIGFLHSQIWDGDILFQYAFVGLVLLALHRLPSKWLLTISANLHVLVMIVMNSNHFYDDKANIFYFIDILEKIMPMSIAPILVYVLVGFALMKMDIFTKLKKRPKLHRILLLSLSSISIIGVTLQLLILKSVSAFNLFLFLLQPFLALTYILLILALLKTKIGNLALRPLQNYGRMAMSNYLGQTVAGIFILPLFINQIQLTFSIVSFCVLTWIVQITLSNVWLKYFNFGPIEWIWRTLTYVKWIPIRKNNI
ncbi:DUF418 domain-containing protein [Bacillus mycoides]|uniref:DUF418 domain-containing protein n=1 Tax=Bacillus mycoides TaxID=1405 RepID=UPI0038269C83